MGYAGRGRGVGAFVRGDVVIVYFPNSAGGEFKKRPTVVLGTVPYAGADDYILCLITSQQADDPHRIELQSTDIMGGSLRTVSYLRPTYLYTADESTIAYKVGTLRGQVLAQAIAALPLC